MTAVGGAGEAVGSGRNVLARAAGLALAGLVAAAGPSLRPPGPSVLAPGPLAAQESGDPHDDAGDDPLVEAPFQFRVGPTVGDLSWDAAAGTGAQRMDDAVMWGLDVASVVGRYAGFRLGGAVGSNSISEVGREDSGIDAVQYLVDVVAEGRLAVGPLHEAGVIPIVSVGGGAVIHDPAPDSLVTRSQSAFIWGIGVDARILDRVGARAEWRRVQAEIQSILDPLDRSGTTRFADRWFLGAYWAF